MALLLLVAWHVAPLSFAGPAEAPPARPAARKNPHLGIDCGACHSEVPEEGSPRGRVLASLAKEPVPLCRECHPDVGDSHHPVMTKTQRALPERFPTGTGGEVICSTCHDVHLAEASTGLLRGFGTGLYLVRMDLCLDCHGEDFLAINPHHSPDGKGRCRACHSSLPGENPTATIREKLDRLCDFCHDIRRKNHPRNVGRMQSLPRWLTLGRTGKIPCASCHDPHGTSDTIHFLREPYLEHIDAARDDNPHGREDYYSCRTCHREVATRREEMERNLLFDGNEVLLCYLCHGEMDACHLVLVTLPPGKSAPESLPLTPDGRVTCSTCHDPTPKGGCNVAIRGIGRGESVSALCHRCHDQAYLAGVNPHTAMSVKTACRFCHAYMRDPERAERFRVSFISHSRVVCLRCHPRDTHPMGTDIATLAPRGRLPEPFRPDRKGRITCTTCHLPHFDAWEPPGREGRGRLQVDATKENLCSRCHGM